MNVKSQAVVLKSMRYGESDLIVKLLTKEKGLLSFLLKNTLKAKKTKIKASYFQIGTILDIDFTFRVNKSFQFLKEVKINHFFSTNTSSIPKISLITFLNEVILQSIPEAEADANYFNFIKENLYSLDAASNYNLFHCKFLMDNLSFLGSQPSLQNRILTNVVKDTQMPSMPQLTLTDDELYNFELLARADQEGLESISMSKKERKQLLKNILNYYKIHISGFKTPKSLAIFEQIFK